jgi:hypothetical protein
VLFLRSAPIAPALRLAVLLAALVFSVEAAAEEDAPRAIPATDTLAPDPDADVTQMTAVLDSQVGNARAWMWSWASVYGAVSITETVLNATSHGGAQSSAQVNIATSTFGFFATVVFPPPVAFEWEPVRHLPEDTDAQRAAKSSAVRAFFAREVARERFRHSVWGHLLGLAFNAGVCSYMYFGLHLGSRALLNFALGGAFWEANLWSSPNASMHLADGLHDVGSLGLQVLPVALGPTGAGFALAAHF